MITQPTRIDRLFSRRLIILSEQPPRRTKIPLAMELTTREFRALGHWIVAGEPARFELADNNFIDDFAEIYTDAASGS